MEKCKICGTRNPELECFVKVKETGEIFCSRECMEKVYSVSKIRDMAMFDRVEYIY